MQKQSNQGKNATCEYCVWWDYGLCDRTGYLTAEDSTCEKWSQEAPEEDQ